MTKFLFHDDPYCAEIKTQIAAIFEEEDGGWRVALEDSLFFPRGGGQKGDIGTIDVEGKEYAVAGTVKDEYDSDGRPLLVLNEEPEDLAKGKAITVRLDWPYRFRQMRLHSAVHLHHCMLEKISGTSLPHPKSSEILDGEAYNRYETKEITEELVNQATEAFVNAVASGAPIVTRDDEERDGFRWWVCLGYEIPCGGTHLHDIKEIGAVEIAYSKRKGKPKVTIRLS